VEEPDATLGFMDRRHTKRSESVYEFEIGSGCITNNYRHEPLQEANAVPLSLSWTRALV
jgi:hypothetical protein